MTVPRLLPRPIPPIVGPRARPRLQRRMQADSQSTEAQRQRHPPLGAWTTVRRGRRRTPPRAHPSPRPSPILSGRRLATHARLPWHRGSGVSHPSSDCDRAQRTQWPPAPRASPPPGLRLLPRSHLVPSLHGPCPQRPRRSSQAPRPRDQRPTRLEADGGSTRSAVVEGAAASTTRGTRPGSMSRASPVSCTSARTRVMQPRLSSVNGASRARSCPRTELAAVGNGHHRNGYHGYY